MNSTKLKELILLWMLHLGTGWVTWREFRDFDIDHCDGKFDIEKFMELGMVDATHDVGTDAEVVLPDNYKLSDEAINLLQEERNETTSTN